MQANTTTIITEQCVGACAIDWKPKVQSTSSTYFEPLKTPAIDLIRLAHDDARHAALTKVGKRWVSMSTGYIYARLLVS